ncbi:MULTISPECIES: LysR family transcriptional regulator [Rhodobacterales]|uniref:HTH-type transcriptional regulator BenM n=1 Tax=Tritonibacter horizontis TaxID=1768241 RepID=A0A132C299_9RHOB|nr:MULTISPECIES: LysR family transcriptional regulator [Rhodobacterales]KHA54154.1 Transcriptional regulator, LysR family [Sulfitobacter geojensis]KUP94160.1 HTH-type transcriptional regulator BenM [Tritonibacter horizontis]NYI29976.1 DNA-binding transcriptional LysR family regulator [Sulfitobacter geojensis]
MQNKPSSLGIRHLRYALAVADAGGFRAAAEMLNIAQPAISKTVRDTEEDLGFEIFVRGTKTVEISENGKRFLDDARQIVAQFERTIRGSRRNGVGDRGHIIVGYSALATSTQLSDGLETFQALYPGVQVEMHVMSTDTMMRNIKTGAIDLGFLMAHDTVRDPVISQRVAWTSPIGLVAPHDTADKTLDALRTAPFIMGVRENWRAYRALLDDAFEKTGFTPVIEDEAWDIHVILQRVADGRGYTFHPITAESSMPRALRIMPLEELDAELSIAIAWSAAADTSLLRMFRAQYASPARVTDRQP